MPIPEEIREELAAKRAAEHRQATGDTRRDLLRSCLEVAFWGALGTVILLSSFHVSSYPVGRILFWAGLGIGNGGMMFSILAAYRRGEKRGDW